LRSRLRLLLIGGIAVGVIGAAASLSYGGLSDWDVAYALPLLLWLVLMTSRLAASSQPLGQMARNLSIFLVLGVVLVTAYSFRDDFVRMRDRALGAFVPGHGTEVAPGMMKFQADDSGQFVVDAKVNGIGVHFLVDTGASGIALSRRDASRLDIDPKTLIYSQRFSTANGMTGGAPVTLDSIEIGPFSDSKVPAFVNEGDLDQSLLGMSYLKTLGRIEIRGDTLILER